MDHRVTGSPSSPSLLRTTGGALVGEDGEEILGDDSDDFVVLRRDVNAGRAVVSGPVLYSVAESVAQPRYEG